MSQWLETHLLNEERDKRNPSWRADAANKLWNTEGMPAPTGEQWRKWFTGIPEVLGEMGKSYLGGMANIADAQNPALMTPVELPNLSQGMVDMATEAAKTFHPDDPRAPLSSLVETVGPWTKGGAINFLPWLPKGVRLLDSKVVAPTLNRMTYAGKPSTLTPKAMGKYWKNDPLLEKYLDLDADLAIHRPREKYIFDKDRNVLPQFNKDGTAKHPAWGESHIGAGPKNTYQIRLDPTHSNEVLYHEMGHLEDFIKHQDRLPARLRWPERSGALQTLQNEFWANWNAIKRQGIRQIPSAVGGYGQYVMNTMRPPPSSLLGPHSAGKLSSKHKLEGDDFGWAGEGNLPGQPSYVQRPTESWKPKHQPLANQPDRFAKHFEQKQDTKWGKAWEGTSNERKMIDRINADPRRIRETHGAVNFHHHPKKDWPRLINEFVEKDPKLQAMVLDLLEKGHQPFSSNYYGHGRKGVFYKTKDGKYGFDRHPNDPAENLVHPEIPPEGLSDVHPWDW